MQASRNPPDAEKAGYTDGSSSVLLDEDEETPEDAKAIEVAKQEERWVWVLRALTAFVLVAVALTVCLGVYFEGRRREKANFENDFANLGEKLVSSFENTVSQRFGLVDTFTNDITSYAKGRWPFVTPPDYDYKAEKVAALGTFMDIVLIPIVQKEDYFEWDEYVQNTQEWKKEGLSHETGIPQDQVVAMPSFPNMINVHNPNGPTPANQINEEGPYYPIWVSYPIRNGTRVRENLDLGGDWEHRGPMENTVATGLPTFEGISDYIEKEKDLRYEVLKKNRNIDYQDDSHTMAFFPGT